MSIESALGDDARPVLRDHVNDRGVERDEVADPRPVPIDRHSDSATDRGIERDEVAGDQELCRRCGVSCHVAILVNGLPIAVPGLHCKHLTEAPRGRFGCAVYESRLQVAPWCHRAKDAAPLGFLARDCPYALRVGARTGKVRPGPAALRPLWPALLGEIQRQGVYAWVSHAPLLEIFRRHAGIEVDLVADPERPDHLLVVERTPAAAQGEP